MPGATEFSPLWASFLVFARSLLKRHHNKFLQTASSFFLNPPVLLSMSPSSGHPRENRNYGGGASSAPPTPTLLFWSCLSYPLPLLPSLSNPHPPVLSTSSPVFTWRTYRVPSFGPGHEGSALIQWKGIGKLGNTGSLLVVVDTSGKLW